MSAPSGTPLPSSQDTSFSCGVCFEGYSETGAQTPLCLPCGHTTCRHCIAQLLTSNSPKCPSCRKRFPAEINQLPKNYEILHLMSLQSLSRIPLRYTEEELMQALERKREEKRRLNDLMEQRDAARNLVTTLTTERVEIAAELDKNQQTLEEAVDKRNELIAQRIAELTARVTAEMTAEQEPVITDLTRKLDETREMLQSKAAQLSEEEAKLEALTKQIRALGGDMPTQSSSSPEKRAGCGDDEDVAGSGDGSDDAWNLDSIVALVRRVLKIVLVLALTGLVVQWVCGAIFTFAVNEGQYPSSAHVVKLRYMVISALAGFSDLKVQLGAAGACETVVNGMRAHAGDAVLVQHGLRAILNLANNHDANMKLAALGAGEIIVEAIKTHSSSPEVAAVGCGAIQNLHSGFERVKHAAFEVVISALRLHVNHAGVSQYGSGAIASLAAVFANDRSNLVALGAGEAVVGALQAHRLNPAVSQWGCLAIWNLALDVNTGADLGAAGALGSVVAAVKTHPKNAMVSSWGSGAIWYLATHPGNRAALVAAGASEVVVSALMAFPRHPEVARQGCGAIWMIAIDSPDNQLKLSSIGARRAVALAIKSHPSNAEVAKHGCRAVMSLASSNVCDAASAAADCATNEASSAEAEAVVHALRMHPSNADVAFQGCLAVSQMASNSDVHRSLLLGAGAGDAVLNAMKSLPTNANVALQGCRAIQTLAADSVDSKRLGAAGAGEGIVMALKVHLSNAQVTEQAATAIYNLAVDQGNLIRLRDAGASEAVLAAILHFSSLPVSDEVVQKGCSALRRMTAVSKINIPSACSST